MIRWTLEKLLFASGFLAGGSLPAFLVQYRQRIGGRLDQVRDDVAHFQKIADQQFGGSLETLIRHHLQSPDPAFLAEGHAIERMSNDFERWSEAYSALDATLFTQLKYFLTHVDSEVARATWADFVPAFAFNVDGLVLALAGGVALSGLLALVLRLARRPATLPRRGYT
jgi:hypothetical protein